MSYNRRDMDLMSVFNFQQPQETESFKMLKMFFHRFLHKITDQKKSNRWHFPGDAKSDLIQESRLERESVHHMYMR